MSTDERVQLEIDGVTGEEQHLDVVFLTNLFLVQKGLYTLALVTLELENLGLSLLVL